MYICVVLYMLFVTKVVNNIDLTKQIYYHFYGFIFY